jgi:hypothetical protein
VSALEPTRLVRVYVLALGAGLLLDTRHNLLHVVWGIGLLAIALTPQVRGSRSVAWAAVVFGVFYVALGVLGVLVDRPFGLLLGPGENAFHFIVGPLAFLLGARALTQTARSHTAVGQSGS